MTVQINQKKPEVRSKVCNLCSVIRETFGVLALFGVMQCDSYSKIKGVIIVILPGEYPVNRVSNPELTSYSSRYRANT
jgi:hypothetical protein